MQSILGAQGPWNFQLVPFEGWGLLYELFKLFAWLQSIADLHGRHNWGIKSNTESWGQANGSPWKMKGCPDSHYQPDKRGRTKVNWVLFFRRSESSHVNDGQHQQVLTMWTQEVTLIQQQQHSIFFEISWLRRNVSQIIKAEDVNPFEDINSKGSETVEISSLITMPICPSRGAVGDQIRLQISTKKKSPYYGMSFSFSNLAQFSRILHIYIYVDMKH